MHLLSSTVVVMVVVSYYYRRVMPFDFSLTRAMLDPKHEQRIQNRTIVEETNKFIASSLNFVRARISRLRKSSTSFYNPSPNGDEQKFESNMSQNKILMDHILAQRQL